MNMAERWGALDLLRDEYEEFPVFLHDVITSVLGFDCTAVQLDIADYLCDGPLYRMIQAQRGQAKTTITAVYAVWRLIKQPSTRVLIVSSGEGMAKEISGWIIQIINNMDELECLRPDKALGDRASVEAFDIHRDLKGPEKSPSVACVGITSSVQGKRADLLIADDIESQKNSQTEVMRERLMTLTRDFTSLCSHGDIVYLGTPQSVNSVYNSLPGRGFGIRIWPGRYPTAEEVENYGAFLAPSISAAIEANPSLQRGGGADGTRGKPIDPVLMDEYTLAKKELDQGAAYFQLQHMLDTRLSDADRYPLKLSRVIFTDVPPEQTPVTLYHKQSVGDRIHLPPDHPVQYSMYRASGHSQEFGAFSGTYMYVDPAGGGQNGDETGYAVTRFSASKVYVVDVGGVKGGLDSEATDALTAIAAKWKPTTIGIERNFGNGALASVWTPTLLKTHACEIEEVWESGQKELRIIDIIEPLIGAGRLVIDEDLITKDWAACQQYPVEKRGSYSLFNQMALITRDKGSLSHEDRLDALAGACRHWVEHLKQDEEASAQAAQQAAYDRMMQNGPLGDGTPVPGFRGGRSQINLSVAASLHRRY